MQFNRWYDEVKAQSERRLGLDFATEFAAERIEEMFAEGDTPTEVIDTLIKRFGLDDLTQIDNPFTGPSLLIDILKNCGE